MFGNSKPPRDACPYPQSSESRQLSRTASIGHYVYVVDVNDVIHVAPDGSHMHPRVLGSAWPALYAGEIFIDRDGNVDEVTNLSGTFRFKSQSSLCCVASELRRLGFSVGDVVRYPADGSSPVILACA